MLKVDKFYHLMPLCVFILYTLSFHLFSALNIYTV